EAHPFADAVEVELIHDPAPMRVDGVDAQVQSCRDLFVRLSLRYQLEDFTFPACEQVERFGDVLAVIGQYRLGNRGTQISVPFGDRADGGQEVALDHVLQQVAARARAKDLTDV